MNKAFLRDRQDIEHLIARVALQDRAAFAALYDATSGKLFSVCLRVLQDKAEAEEVLQDVYLRIWHKADMYRVTGHSPMTWLITVARNLSIDRLRARRVAREDELEEAGSLADDAAGPEETVMARSDAARIVACLEELDAAPAAAVRGAYLMGLSYADLAERHGVPLNTMRTWLRRSLMKLKKCMTR